ncbi:MAG: ABC transporter permease [Acetobacteraceae bacterium]
MSLGRFLNVYSLFAVVFAVGYALFPPFRHWSNMSELLGDSVPLLLVAVAQLFAMVVWGIDLSVGSIMNVVITVASFTFAGPWYALCAGMIGCIVLGAGLGLVNGLLISRLRLPDFVVTMATFIGYQGLALTIRPTPGGSVNPGLLSFTYASTLHIPNPTWVAAGLLCILAYVLHASRLGHYMVAVGSNRENSYLLGLPVERVRTLAYVMSGVAAAMAGVFLMGLIGTGSADAADPYQLDSIIATVIGGTSLYGGEGSVLGTVFGVLILEIALKMLTYANLLGSYIQVFDGAAVLVVVALLSAIRFYGRDRRRSKRALPGEPPEGGSTSQQPTT